eukprot:1158244-Pelagomonas_calceolata.AAC.6
MQEQARQEQAVIYCLHQLFMQPCLVSAPRGHSQSFAALPKASLAQDQKHWICTRATVHRPQ